MGGVGLVEKLAALVPRPGSTWFGITEYLLPRQPESTCDSIRAGNRRFHSSPRLSGKKAARHRKFTEETRMPAAQLFMGRIDETRFRTDLPDRDLSAPPSLSGCPMKGMAEIARIPITAQILYGIQGMGVFRAQVHADARGWRKNDPSSAACIGGRMDTLPGQCE